MRIIIIAILSFLPCAALQAQFREKNYELFAHYSSDNGLPQNSITGIQQDKNGFIWITTNGGLVRFDGSNFRVFNTVQFYTRASNRLHSLFLFREHLYAEEANLDKHFRIEDENTIRAVPREAEVLWRMRKAYAFSPEVAAYRKKYGFDNWVELVIDSTATEGYTPLSGMVRELQYYRYPEKPVPLGLHSWHDMDNCFTSGSRLYVIDGFSEVVCIDRTRRIPVSGSFVHLVKSADIVALKEAILFNSGGFNFLSMGRHFYRLEEKAPGVVDAQLLTDAAPVNKVTSAFYLPDKHMLLLGTGDNGIYLYRQRNFTSITIPETIPGIFSKLPLTKVPSNIFYEIRQQHDSALFTVWGTVYLSGRISPPGAIYFAERNIPEVKPGLFIGHLPGQAIPHFTNAKSEDLGLLDSNLTLREYHKTATEKDTLYISIRDKLDSSFIFKYLLRSTHRAVLLDRYPIPRVSVDIVCKPAGDTLWVGGASGLMAINLRTKQTALLPGLEKAIVRTIYTDRNNTCWIGTYGKGWYRLDKRGLVKLFKDRNGYLENVHALLEDDKGFFWISTNNGLFRFQRTDLEKLTGPADPAYYNYFSREYGFLSNEFNGGSNPSALKLSDGRFVFPSMNGLVLFNPATVPVELPPSTIRTGEYILDGASLGSIERQQLSPRFNNLSLQVYIPYLGQGYNLQVEYRLSRGSGKWALLPPTGQINFNRLTPGRYTLSIRMLKGYGSGDYITKEINFEVSQFWYQTPLFYAGLLVLVIILAIVYTLLRTRSIQRQKQQLEKEVVLRTAALQASEEKERQNAEFKARITSLVLHDVRSPLYYLNKITASIYKTSEGQAAEEFREQLKDLHLSVKDISSYAQTLFAWISAQQDNFILSPSNVKLRDLFEEVEQNYSLLARQNSNSIILEPLPDIVVYTQSDLLQIVLRNLVDNAIKYTQNGKIVLEASIQASDVLIRVRDTGKGMATEKIRQITSSEGPGAGDTRSGMGYRFIRDLLEKMGGRLQIDSVLTKGTTVTIILPARTER